SFAYDADGRRTSKTLANGLTTDYTYDAASRVTDTTFRNGPTTLGNLTYQYNIQGKVEITDGSFGRTLIASGVNTSTYDLANQQLGFGGNSYTFDNNGNRLSTTDGSGTTNYTWNARNQLIGVAGPGISATYAYDGLGRQQSSTINGALTEFLYDGSVPVQESAGASLIANNLTLPGFNEFLTRGDGTGTSYFLTDKSLSTLALANQSGSIQSEYTYNPFGGASLIAGAPSNNPYQFRGSSTDASGLRRSSGGSGPNWDPISVTQLNPIPMMIPFNQPYDQIAPNPGDPDDPSRSQGPPSQAGGPEGGRKNGDSGPGDTGTSNNDNKDSSKSRSIRDRKPIKPPIVVIEPLWEVPSADFGSGLAKILAGGMTLATAYLRGMALDAFGEIIKEADGTLLGLGHALDAIKLGAQYGIGAAAEGTYGGYLIGQGFMDMFPIYKAPYPGRDLYDFIHGTP